MKNTSRLALAAVAFLAWGVDGRAEALPLRPPIPKDNPMSPAKVSLGKQLFFDGRLSKSFNGRALHEQKRLQLRHAGSNPT